MTVAIAVFGAGFMGANHARVLSSMPSARLALVVDPDPERARALADEFDCPWSSDPSSLDGSIDAAIIATPTETHADLGIRILSSGLHVLVEKPLAMSVAQAGEIVAAADRAGKVLAVGHVERFNPACLDLPRFVTEPLLIQTRRLSPYNDHVREGVVRDMMIHDIDIVLWLAKSPPLRVTAELAAPRSETEDVAVATVVFGSGMISQMIATRIGQDKVRRIDVIEADSVVNVDLMRQDITIRRQATTEYPNTGTRRLKEASVREIPYLENRGEPLWLELSDFVAAIEGNGSPLVDGRAGIAALELCERILQAGGAA